MALTTTTDSSSQTATGSPQTAAGASGVASAQSGGVQPGTAVSLLNSQVGIQLHGTALTNVNLSTSTTSVTLAPLPTPKHHVNAALFGVSALLIMIAAALFVIAKRSVKTTT